MKFQRQRYTIIFHIAVTFILAALAVWILLTYRALIEPNQLRVFLSQYGIWAPLVFIIIIIIATLLFIPSLPLCVAGGLMFGLFSGTLYIMLGSILGSLLAFLIARYFCADLLEKRMGPRSRLLVDNISREGWQYVIILRLIPFAPFNLLNYAFGLTRIRLSLYTIASTIGMFPSCFAYCYLGHIGGETASNDRIIFEALVALSCLTLLAFLPAIMKNILKKKGIEY
jgi:uncharacterized membrane protein YdjX (TVP38/TMEM64 family)